MQIKMFCALILNFELKNAHISPIVDQSPNNRVPYLFASYLLREDGQLNQYILTLAILKIFRICKIKIDSPDGNGDVVILLDLNF